MATANFTHDAFLNEAEIIGKFGGASRLRNAVNQRQSLLYSPGLAAKQPRTEAEVERQLSLVVESAMTVSANHQCATRLRQPGLEKAFTLLVRIG